MVAREPEGIAGCRSPKGFRRPFNVVTRSFLKYSVRPGYYCTLPHGATALALPAGSVPPFGSTLGV